ncbi:acyl carrier protein [Jatrophihabitans lederbergiae]|jgi:acyl carrier protein|uniref:Acyl carrier protein n=1 Tax=Jatrophihabitans lederbergiae TaxID=3075547 RepID=A0ABU2JD07_9ACTN|nr:acyl carrier protein [Jatrophihabitans sp. DSM 44399]MDT0262148.1 acyl carrier protein [Jatrophihabitans sp. DSM 44399]
MYEKLKQIMCSKFQVPSAEFVPGVTFEDLGLDSLDLVELSLVIEQEIGVRISDDELAEVGQLNNVADLVTSRRATV